MGRASRRSPDRLAEKLLQIRLTLDLSQNDMVNHLGLSDELTREDVSKFERGIREPSLPVLLEYAKAAGVWLDVMIDDDLDLPKKLPSFPRHEGIRRKSARRTKIKR